MNAVHLDLIRKLTLGKISEDDFLLSFPYNPAKDKTYFLRALDGLLLSKNADDLEHVLLLGFHFGFPEESAIVLCKLMLEEWHTQHENIALVLKDLRCPDSVDCLFSTALKKFLYLEYDESNALAVKCIYALRAIGTDRAKEKLILLAEHNDEIIRSNAKRALDAMKGE